MKKIYVSLLLSAILSFVFIASFSQSITLGSLGNTSFCPSGTLAVPFTTDLPAGTIFRVYLSSSSGSFTRQTQIGSGTTSPINITFPETLLSSGTGYRIKVQAISNGMTTSSISGSLSTTNKQLSIAVKNLMGREIPDNFFMLCEGSAITGMINPDVSNQTFKWEKDGVLQSNNQSLRITETGSYLATTQQLGCNSVSRTTFIYFNGGAFDELERVGSEYQCAGGSITFREKYYSDSTTYQWKKDGNIIVGATKDTLNTSQSGTYTVDITDKCPVYINPAITNLNSRVVFSNSIENQVRLFFDNGTAKLCGSNTSIDLGANGLYYQRDNPLNTYTYQWKKNGVDIPFKTTNQLNGIQDTGIYTVAISQGSCTSISNGVEIVKVDTIKLSYRIPKPYTNEICSGMETQLQQFTDIIYGITRDLYKDGNLYKSNVSGSFNVNETGDYVVKGTASGCTIIPSNTIKIIVGNTLKSTLFTRNTTFCNGGATTLTLNAYSYPTLTGVQLQWFKNNAILSGETNNSIGLFQPGYYKIRVTSGSCSGFSDSIEVKVVTTLPKLKMYYEQGNLINSSTVLCSNNVLRMYARDLSSYSYELENDSIFWKRNGVIISKELGAGKSFYATQNANYTVVRKQGTCESESDPVEIKIGEPITANITGSTSIYPGQKAKLNLNFTGGNAWSYQTSDVATGQTTSLSPTLKNVSPSSTQTYSITSVASNCSVGTVSGNAIVTVLPCPTTQAISINSGNWNNTSTWVCGQMPSATLDTIIDQGHTVNLPNSYQGNVKKLELKGAITQGAGASLKVNN